MERNKLIEKSEHFIQWLDHQIDGLDVPSDFRNRYAAACLYMAMEHQKAIVLLVAKQLYGVAFSLVRLICESYVRGVWLHKCAQKSELEKFAKGRVPKFGELVEAIEKLEEHENKILSNLKARSWKAMNEFTHTGFSQVSRLQTETSIEANYDDDEILEVVNFANAIGCLASISTCALANNGELANTILEKFKAEGLTKT